MTIAQNFVQIDGTILYSPIVNFFFGISIDFNLKIIKFEKDFKLIEYKEKKNQRKIYRVNLLYSLKQGNNK